MYHTLDEGVPAQARNQYYKGNGYQFTAVGNNLPDTDVVEIDMQGKWVKNQHGMQLQVDNYEEILPQTEEGIMGYLSSGMVKGIGPKTAKLIVDRLECGPLMSWIIIRIVYWRLKVLPRRS